jgi:tetratricopeptide (TPR) repeat protein
LLLARQVTHKNVVRIHDLGEIDGIKYITMPYVEGDDLATILKQSGKLPMSAALGIAKQVAAGLQAAHEAGVVHRDLKPANIMISGDQALIMDFGIARSVSGYGGATVLGAVIGTLEYMAPEQAKGQPVDQRADIYAFGLILYDMLAGRRQAASGESAVAELMGRIQQPPRPLRSIDSTIPEAVELIVARCVHPDAFARYQLTQEVAADLDLLDADGQPTDAGLRDVARRKARTDSAFALPSAHRWIGVPQKVWLAAAAVLVVAMAGVVSFKGRLFVTPSDQAKLTSDAVTLAILPFRNASSDPALDWLGTTVAEMLRTEVGQSARVRAVSSDRLNQALRDLRVSPGSSFDESTVKRLAEFSNAQRVVTGQYLKIGGQIRLEAALEDLGHQRRIPLRAEAPNEEQLMSAISALAASIQQNVASSPDVVKELRAASLKPSTSSVQALRYYHEGVQFARRGAYAEALKQFQASTNEDPQFALAHSRLALAQWMLGFDGEAEAASAKAMDASEALPAREKYLIQANHARVVNDHAKALEAYENLAKVSSDDPDITFDLATLYETRGAIERAYEQFGKVLARDPSHLEALVGLGRVELKRNHPEQALKYLNQALSTAVELDNDEEKGAVLTTIGGTYKRLNKPEEALRYYSESLELERRLGHKGALAATLNEIGQTQKRIGKPDEALASYQEALALRRAIGNKRGIGISLMDLGALHIDRARYDEALKFFKESLQIQREVGNQTLEATCLNNIGNVYYFKGSYDEALTYYERTLQVREKTQSPADIAQSLHNIAETYLKMGQYDQALAQYLRALEQRRAAADKRGIAIESYSIGTLFEYQGRYGAALKSKEEAIRTFREIKDRTFWMAEVLGGYGNSLSQVGRVEEAGKNLAEALTVAQQLKNNALVAQTLNFQADLFFYRGDFRSARPLAEQALEAASKTTDEPMVLLSKLNVAKLHVKEGRIQTAMPALQSLALKADELGLKHLSIEAALYRAEALLATNHHAQARGELEAVLRKSDKLGARALVARSHFLLGEALGGANRAAAAEHLKSAERLVQEIRQEAGSDAILQRADLAPIAKGE